MKKLILFFAILLYGVAGFGQTPINSIPNLSPSGLLDNIFDNYGNQYRLADIKIPKSSLPMMRATATPATILQFIDCGYYRLYFEAGSGFEDTTIPSNNARRAVLKQVFEDLSAFINSPLMTTGNKVNIWVRKIDNITSPTTGVLGLATAFYNMPSKNTTGFGGIVDNEIWKTIHTGVDSYTNTTTLLTFNPTQSTGTAFYHGMMAFNFMDTTSPINWNTNLAVSTPSNLYDLYTVVLHEVIHALGFNSLIRNTGISKFGIKFNYYSRYDSFLKNNSINDFLITNNSTCSTMYNYSFNSLLNTSILQPGTPPCIPQQTNCATAIKYVGTSIVPVYTPNCFSTTSSLSHFEDQCIDLPNGNNSNAYFTMTDAIDVGITKRYLKPEEKNVLCDIGYNTNRIFGSIQNYTYKDYGIDAVCSGINVAGINDGINIDNTYSYIGSVSPSNISISGILNNDFSATRFECLEDVYDNTASFSATSGTNLTTIIYNTTISGVHLLRYLPVSLSGQIGNITYIYVYVLSSSCSSTPMCNLINNGGFEFSENCGQFGVSNPQPKLECWEYLSQSPDLFTNGCAISSNNPFAVGINTFNSTPPTISYSGGLDNFIGLYCNPNSGYLEAMQTKLSTPLINGNSYILSFWAKKNNGYPNIISNAPTPINFSSFNGYLAPIDLSINSFQTVMPNSIQIVPTSLVPNDNLWHNYNYSFTFINSSNHNSLSVYGGLLNSDASYVFIDEISIIPQQMGNLTFPNSICINQKLPDLRNYLSSNINPSGNFYGNGVSFENGFYTFNATANTNYQINYNYTDASTGCNFTISGIITVNSAVATTPTFTQIAPICSGATLGALPTTSTNNISGTWSPALNNLATTNYTFTPTTGQCATTTTMTVVVKPPTDPTCNTCLSNLSLTTEPNTTFTYKSSNWIMASSNYTIANGKDITMKAQDYIWLKPNTHIIAGAKYHGRIEVCVPGSNKIFSKESNNTQKTDTTDLSIYPNPTNDFVTISSDSLELGNIMIVSFDGKVVYNQTANSNNQQLDLSNYASGVYILTVETKNGETYTRKLIKK